MDRKHCAGCHDNFYNIEVGECWSLKDAKLILRKEVSIDQRPPWDQKAKLIPNCYHQPRYVYVKPEQVK